MTHRVHPYIFRIGALTTWQSRWFGNKLFAEYLREDTSLRHWLGRKLRTAHIKSIEIERFPNLLHVIIRTARPGIVIGRGGEGAERLKREIEKFLVRLGPPRRQVPRQKKPELKVTIEEIRSPETHAAVAAEMIVEDLEKRLPFRRVLKQALDKISQAREVEGVKIAIKGRLDGAEMARYEWGKRGRVPLQTIRADVDYSEKTAYTAYGTIGVKVWIYKGEVFEKENRT
jgi:small subunit ribosomal protein S3